MRMHLASAMICAVNRWTSQSFFLPDKSGSNSSPTPGRGVKGLRDVRKWIGVYTEQAAPPSTPLESNNIN